MLGVVALATVLALAAPTSSVPIYTNSTSIDQKWVCLAPCSQTPSVQSQRCRPLTLNKCTQVIEPELEKTWDSGKPFMCQWRPYTNPYFKLVQSGSHYVLSLYFDAACTQDTVCLTWESLRGDISLSLTTPGANKCAPIHYGAGPLQPILDELVPKDSLLWAMVSDTCIPVASDPSSCPPATK